MSNAFVRAAEARDAEAICSLLHNKMNSRIPIDRWRRLMSYNWLKDKPDFGRVVESDGAILGYCGMVYADRLVGNPNQLRTNQPRTTPSKTNQAETSQSNQNQLRPERIVSMSSWYLDKSLRGKGLGRDMLISSISNPSLTYATLTNSKKPLGIVEALGFQVLEDHRYSWRKTGVAHSAVIITSDLPSISDRIEPHQQQLIDDMHGYALTPLLVELDGQQALLFFSIKLKDADVLWYDLMHASDYELFVHCAQALADQLLPDTPAVLAIDGRFVKSAPPEATREALPVARYYVSNRVAPNEIDHLYSELQLLDLKLD